MDENTLFFFFLLLKRKFSSSIVKGIHIFVPCQFNLQFQNKRAEAEEEGSYLQWSCSWRHHLRKVIIDKFEDNDAKETVINFFLENKIMVETTPDL